MEETNFIPTPPPEELSPEYERLPLVPAIRMLAPNTNWYLEGNTLAGFKWLDKEEKRPSNEAIIAKARELVALAPITRLRGERNRRMRDVDWVTLRSARTGEPIPQEWKDYMQALADITETYPNVEIVNNMLVGVTWPERPDGVPADPNEWRWFRG